MTVLIISIDHYLQYVEAEADSEALRASKERLRAILVEILGKGTAVVLAKYIRVGQMFTHDAAAGLGI